MAQAARLSLRLQKELKLLHTDPPPGTSFPSLSDASSLTAIDALLQGPGESVYANGVFKIKIQIPERYPFQPPIVTFATPIYHPNIDNGGRICLDILNLPPKGTWQPSLNISTVLTSIGLLLSEPNPDDGLMHEASKEYKYNRHAFDQNARFMTEKYARAGQSEGTMGRHGNHSHSCPSAEHSGMKGPNASICVTEHVCLERSSGTSKEMSPEFSGSCSNFSANIYEAPIRDCLINDANIRQLKEAIHISDEHSGNPGKLQGTRNKLSLRTSVVSHGQNGTNPCFDLPTQCSSGLEHKTLSSDSRTLLPSISSSGVLVGSQQHLENEKENLHPVQDLLPQPRDQSAVYLRAGNLAVVEALKLSETAEELQQKPGAQFLGCDSDDAIVLNYENASSPHPMLLHVTNDIGSDCRQLVGHDFGENSLDRFKKCTEGTLRPEAVIVLDSEDSDDDNAPVKSKLCLAKRCLTRKRKSSF